MPPPEGFLRCTPNYEVDRAEILHSLWGIFCATFGKKRNNWVMSGHRAVTSQEVQVQAILREIAEYGTLEGNIEASFDYFRSELTL